jgi:hypothetical protein
MEAHVTAHSQAYRLREEMAQAKVQHGQEIRADLPGHPSDRPGPRLVHRAARCRGRGLLLQHGADPAAEGGDLRRRGPLPTEVVVDGLEVAGGGTYDLFNVVVRSNGDLRLIVDEATEVVPVVRERQRLQGAADAV